MPADPDARLMRTVLDGLPAMIGYWDRDQRNVIANAALVEWFGMSPEKIRGMHLRDVLGAERYAADLPHITGVLGGQTQVFERTLVDAAGRSRHTEVTYAPDISGGQVAGFFALSIDVTARVEAQRALAEAQRIAEIGSYGWDRATGTVEWSDEMYRIAGVDPAGFRPTAESVLDLVHPDDRAALSAAFAHAVADGQDYRLDYRLMRPTGEVRYVRSRAQVVKGPDGSTARVNGTAQDVTEAQRVERELTRLNAELDRANVLQADLIAMLGHDGRQPLALMRLLIESLLVAWEELPDEVKQADLRRAVRGAYELGQLFDDVLAMTQLEAGQVAPATTPTPVADAVDSSLALAPADVEVRVDVEAGLTVVAAAWQLRQMITNLISNAAKYGAPPIEVLVRQVGDRVEISVADGGRGVPEAFVPHLFERFARPKQTGQRGTGFGLYIVRRLAQLNGGSVGYRANLPTGAVFTLSLPAGRPPAAPS